MIPGVEEVGKTARSFFEVLRESPLSLALVVVILALVALLFYTNATTQSLRNDTTKLIIDWQKQTDTLMANCVSQDVTKMMLDNVHQVTQTMLATAQKDLDRMQRAVDAERENNRKLVDDAMKRLQRYVPPPGLPFPPSRNVGAPDVCDPEQPFCMPQ
jgi:hypothetical protein